MSIRLLAKVEMSEFDSLARDTIGLLAYGTIRAVRFGLEEAADYARTHHAHRRRSGAATSTENLYAELRGVSARGAWGYLVNRVPHARFIEEGTRPHPIWPKEGHGMVGPLREGQGRRARADVGTHRIALRWYVGGRPVFARMVHHPGTRAMPFMRPASEYAAEVIEREINTFTLAQIARLWG